MGHNGRVEFSDDFLKLFNFFVFMICMTYLIAWVTGDLDEFDD